MKKGSYEKMRIITVIGYACLLLTGCTSASKTNKERPNILWVIVEDMSSHFGYNGESLVYTPTVNKMAEEGIVFTNAYVTGPVCSTSRSALITGMYQTTIGTQHHYSSRGELKIHLPDSIRSIPEYMREAGYYTSNANHKFDGKGKEDYDYVYSSEHLFDGIDWVGRAEGQPFFAQVQLRGGKLRNIPKWYDEVVGVLDPEIIVEEEDVTLPPYYPDVETFRLDWAQYLNTVQYTDVMVGRVMDRLKRDGVLDDTIIFFMADHGLSQARGKQFLYDEGSRIPFIIWAPRKFKSEVRREPIIHIDMAATTLQLAGIEIPEYMQAQALLGEEYQARDYIVCARDRCDETVDRIRSMRRGNYKYIKNYLPQRPDLQPNLYKDHKPWMPVLRELDKEGGLNEVQQLVTRKTRPEEELYDLSSDVFEVSNLAGDPAYAEILQQFREDLTAWIEETGDLGMDPEREERYDSNMKWYLERRSEDPELKENIALMKKWAMEGK